MTHSIQSLAARLGGSFRRSPLAPFWAALALIFSTAVAAQAVETVKTNQGGGADSYIRSGAYATTNFGSTETVVTKNGAGDFGRKIYLRFDLSNVSGDRVKTAILRLESVLATSDTISVYSLNDGSTADGASGWAEGSITWNNAPANDTTTGNGVTSGATLVGTFVQSSSTGPMEFSGQSLVDLLNNDTNNYVTLILTSATNSVNEYYSKEFTPVGGSLGGEAPELELALEDEILANEGGGADAYVRSGSYSSTNFGAEATMITKNGSGDFGRKIYTRFDLSGLNWTTPSVTLSLINAVASADTISVYGLNDGTAGDGASGWAESTLTWDNAPANDIASGNGVTSAAALLGSFAQSGSVGEVTFASQALTDFVNNDTNDRVTLILVSGASSTPVNQYYTKEHVPTGGAAGDLAPMLLVELGQTHTITATAGSNGSITPSGNVVVGEGADQSFTISPNTGYHVGDVLVDGASVGAVTSYTFTNVTADHTISASFALNTYIISATAGANGSIAPSGDVVVGHGADQGFSMTGGTGYHVADVLVDGLSVGAVSSYTFVDVTASHTISVSFALNQYTIDSSAGPNGSISPLGTVLVDHGGSQGYTIAADLNYHIGDVLVDGTSVGAVSSYTFSNVVANHTISASFEADTQSALVSTADGAGADSYVRSGAYSAANFGADTAVVTKNGSGDFARKIYLRFDLSGVSWTSNMARLTLTNAVASADTISVYGLNDGATGDAANGWGEGTLTWDNAPANNTASGNGMTSAASLLGTFSQSGSTGALTFTSQALIDWVNADTNGSVTLMVVSGSGTTAVNQYYSKEYVPSGGAAGDLAPTLRVEVADIHTITATAGTNGSVTPSGAVSVVSGDNQAFSIAPNSGYVINDVLVDGVSVGAVTSYQFNNVVADHTLSASFAVSGPTYYVATNGSNSNPGTSSQPWRDVSYADGQLVAGDTLVIRNGIYHDSLSLSTNGTASKPILVKAENDGQATIDGDGLRVPATITADYVIVEGLIFRESSAHIILVNDGADHNIIRRCSAYYGPFNENRQGIKVDGKFNLIEDCVAGGIDRHCFVTHDTEGEYLNNTIRRCFAATYQFAGNPRGSNSGFNVYGASNCIIENGIVWGGAGATNGISVHANTAHVTMSARDNKVLGTIVLNSPTWGVITGYGYNCYNNTFENLMLHGNEGGIASLQRDDEDNGGMVYRNITVYANTVEGIDVVSVNSSPRPIFTNCFIYQNPAGWDGYAPGNVEYCNSYGNSSNQWPAGFGAGSNGNISTAPGSFGLTIRGSSPMSGAGKNGADIGANIYYRYIDGQLTGDELWPWPMAGRIQAELGIDVMAELEAKFGPIVPPGS